LFSASTDWSCWVSGLDCLSIELITEITFHAPFSALLSSIDTSFHWPMAQEAPSEPVQPERKTFQLKEPPPIQQPNRRSFWLTWSMAFFAGVPSSITPKPNYRANGKSCWRMDLHSTLSSHDNFVFLLFLPCQSSPQLRFFVKSFRSFTSIWNGIDDLNAKQASEMDQFYDEHARDVVNKELFSMFCKQKPSGHWWIPSLESIPFMDPLILWGL
jgi:hypothetical protein